MDHFTDEAWLDFVRGLAQAAQTSAIKQHLELGCRECRDANAFWSTVAKTMIREAGHQPPQESAVFVDAAYAAWRWTHVIAKRARMARLVFDSLLEPAPSGIRSNSLSPRRMVQRAGPWIIDLRLQPETGSRMSLAGQIIRAGKKTAEAIPITVALITGDRVLEQTSANEFGEFQFEFDRSGNARLFFYMPGRRPIGLRLPESDDVTIA